MARTANRRCRAKSGIRSRADEQHRWKPQHRRAAAFRAAGFTWNQVAAKLGYNPKTVRTYSALSGWDDLVASAVDDDTRALIRDNLIPSIEYLKGCLTDDDRKAGVKAAMALISLAEKFGPLRERPDDDQAAAEATATIEPGKLTVRAIWNPPRETPREPPRQPQDDGDGETQEGR